jgi:hypothetical protein
MLPSTRELAAKYHLSHVTVAQELQHMVDQGVLTTVPRVGMFVAKSMGVSTDLYLLLTHAPTHPARTPWADRIRVGFEERIAQLGGMSGVLPVDIARTRREKGQLPNLVGVLDASGTYADSPRWDAADPAQRVRIASASLPGLPTPGDVDVIHFDDVGGGRLAVAHLLDHGCRRIAFLGLHGRSELSLTYAWSAARAAGWREELTARAHDLDGLDFSPDRDPVGFDDEVEVAALAARELVHDVDVDGVVCANDHAALGLINALRESGRPHDRWPALIGFDGLPAAQNAVLSSLRLPWEDVGRVGAELLFSRHIGRLDGPRQNRALSMTLIPRMSSRPAWAGHIEDLLPYSA